MTRLLRIVRGVLPLHIHWQVSSTGGGHAPLASRAPTRIGTRTGTRLDDLAVGGADDPRLMAEGFVR